MSIFEKASRTGLRFECAGGSLSVDDLWKLPLKSKTRTNLDDMAKHLNKKLQDKEMSFVDDKTTEDEVTQLKFDIVRHIIGVRLEEDKTRALAAENSEKKQKILGIIAMKKEKELMDMPIEELEKLL